MTKKNDIFKLRMNAALNSSDWPSLIRTCKQSLRKNSNHLQANRYLGFALYKNKSNNEAEIAFKKAIKYLPNDSELLINYGNFLLDLARNHEALPILEKVVSLKPEISICWIKLAQCCYLISQNKKGFDAAEKALSLKCNEQEYGSALIQRSVHRRELGQIKEALQDTEEVIRLFPHDPASYTNRMLFLLADPLASAEKIFESAKEFSQAFENPLKPSWPDFKNIDNTPWRRLKIGFISPDFRDHPVMYSAEGVLALLDRRQFEVFAFYTFPKSDSVTERVMRHVDHFFSFAGVDAEEQAQKIKDLDIDILIDLAGHTGGNALLTLARKPAPVQVSWLGFPATTGLQAVDYKISDELTDPSGAENQYSESLYRLPTLFCCYRPLVREPLWRYQPAYQVKPSPAINNFFITFGTCNNLGKITDEVLTLWGKIISEVPNSRLLIEGKNFGDEITVAQYRKKCESLGIDIERLDLVNLDKRNQYLTYHKIDIALDPFPLAGGTTTFDLLWMGVPLVTMQGNGFKSRMGASMLTHLNRTQWIAEDSAQYIEIAKNMAGNFTLLNAERERLRSDMEFSVMMYENIFVKYFGEGLRAMWLEWLSKQITTVKEDQLKLMKEWIANYPNEWEESSESAVGWEPGEKISLFEAYDRLQAALKKAKETSVENSDFITNIEWINVTSSAEKILTSVPHDPVALAALAEVEYAYGHIDHAVTYLKFASNSINNK